MEAYRSGMRCLILFSMSIAPLSPPADAVLIVNTPTSGFGANRNDLIQGFHR